MSRNPPFRQAFVCNAPRGSAPLVLAAHSAFWEPGTCDKGVWVNKDMHIYG